MLALNHHKTFLSSSNLRSRNEDSHSNRHREETGTTPLFSGIVLDGVQANIFKQYGLLGEKVVNTGPVGQGVVISTSNVLCRPQRMILGSLSMSVHRGLPSSVALKDLAKATRCHAYWRIA